MVVNFAKYFPFLIYNYFYDHFLIMVMCYRYMVTKKETEYVSESDDEPEPEPAKKQPIPKVCLEFIKSNQCCGSGMCIPDPGSEFFPSRILIFSISDPGSASKFIHPKN
jgi:hypothetical protein